MTKKNPYKIGASSDKPSKFIQKRSAGSTVNGKFDRISESRSYSNSNKKIQFNNKNRPIKRQFKPRNQKGRVGHRNNNEGSNLRYPRNNHKAKRQKQYIKRQDRSNEKWQIKKIDSENAVADLKKQKQKRIKHNRVIIRNLVFDVQQTHLRKLLSPFGQIIDIHIPQNPDKKGSRGFAFVEFGNRNHALKAIKDLNDTTFKGRKIVLDESVSKQRFLESKINEEEKQKELTLKYKDSNQKIKQSKIQKIEQQQQTNKHDENQPDDYDDEQADQNDSELKAPKKQEKGGKRQKTEAEILQDISSEVFIRNLSINVDEKTLHQFFRKYGQLKFAKIVINKETGLSKGSAFLKFQDPVKAKQLIDYSKNYEMNLLGKNPSFRINPAINLELQGTILKLFPCESRTNIQQKVEDRQQKDRKREEKKKEEEKKKKPIKKVRTLKKLVQYDPNDKRNLKLALHGINKMTEEMRQKDQERFRNHEKEKIQKLKNPNNSVSDKRIILKFLGKEISEQDIRNLCEQYLQETECKPNNLTYCKLMLESLETKKSAGFAFVEFKTHEISLGFLQWIAQQPSKLMKEPFICEFAIQDSRKMMKLQNKNKVTPNRNKTNMTNKTNKTNNSKNTKNKKQN